MYECVQIPINKKESVCFCWFYCRSGTGSYWYNSTFTRWNACHEPNTPRTRLFLRTKLRHKWHAYTVPTLQRQAADQTQTSRAIPRSNPSASAPPSAQVLPARTHLAPYSYKVPASRAASTSRIASSGEYAHVPSPMDKILNSSPARTMPPRSTTAKIPSRGKMQSPAK